MEKSTIIPLLPNLFLHATTNHQMSDLSHKEKITPTCEVLLKAFEVTREFFRLQLKSFVI